MAYYMTDDDGAPTGKVSDNHLQIILEALDAERKDQEKTISDYMNATGNEGTDGIALSLADRLKEINKLIAIFGGDETPTEEAVDSLIAEDIDTISSPWAKTKGAA